MVKRHSNKSSGSVRIERHSAATAEHQYIAMSAESKDLLKPSMAKQERKVREAFHCSI